MSVSRVSVCTDWRLARGRQKGGQCGGNAMNGQ